MDEGVHDPLTRAGVDDPIAQAEVLPGCAANVTIVEDASASANACMTLQVSTPPPPQGMVVEKFIADTGANRTVHP